MALLKTLNSGESNRKINRGHHVLNNKQGCYKQGQAAKGLVSCITESVRIKHSIKGVISTKKPSYLPILLRYENNWNPTKSHQNANMSLNKTFPSSFLPRSGQNV